MPTAPTPITALPTPPDSVDTVNFSPRTDVFLGQLAEDTVDEMNALGTNAYNNAVEAVDAATTATTKAAEAAASAASAVNAPGTSATSTTSLAVGSGSKSLTIQTGKAFAVGQPVRVARTSAPATTWMQCIVGDHDPVTGALDVVVGAFAGSGTHTDWTVSLSGSEALETATVDEVRAGAGNKALTPANQDDALEPVVVADAATVAWDLATAPHGVVTTTASRTIGEPTGAKLGKFYSLRINSTGEFTPTLNTCFVFDEMGAGAYPTGSTRFAVLDVQCISLSPLEFRANLWKSA